MDEEKLIKAKQRNVKIYPIYKMFSWDLLFYYSINFLFLNQAKGLSASYIVIGNAFYKIFKIIFQPIIPVLVNIIGKRKSTILGNIFVSISILYTIIGRPSIIYLIISNFIIAIGYLLKGVCEASILDECIIDTNKKNSIFSKIDGRGSAYWYIFEAISSVLTGFLFIINAYIPMYLCFLFCIIGTVISANFEHYEVKKTVRKESHRFKRFINRLELSKQEYLFILKSKRLKALILFSGAFHGLLYIRSTLTSSILVEMGVPDKYFGIIIGILTIFAAITTLSQNLFHKKLRNKFLTVASLTYIFTLILIGIITNLKIGYTLTLIIVMVLMMIQNMIKGPYYTLIKRYLNSFSNEQISTKIYSVNTLMEDLCGTIISLMVSLMLAYTSTAYTILFLGIISLIVFIVILDFMKTRLGLAPEEYKKQDIEFVPKIKTDIEQKERIEIIVGLDEEGNNSVYIK